VPENATAARPGAAAAAVSRASNDQPQYTPPHSHQPSRDPIYNALIDRRKCSTCGARDRWQRLVDGGWYCCWDGPDDVGHGGSAHRCSAVCVLGGAA
jgi:hypothetical protein